MIKAIRQVHLCCGIFFAPTIIFFCITGAFQTFGLHESKPEDSFQTPPWLAAAAEVHKNQAYKLSKPVEDESTTKVEPANVEKVNPESAKTPEPKITRKKPKKHTSQVLKWFVLFMAIGLIVGALSGIYMAFTYKRDRKLVWGLLIAGSILPFALLFL